MVRWPYGKGFYHPKAVVSVSEILVIENRDDSHPL
jgi:hypothetical protein